jgi:micrococcal nuclease
MKKLLVACGVWTFVLVSLVLAQAATSVVTRVIDGDTLVVSGVGIVRLIGVDTPETVDPRKPVQEFGRGASAFTKRLAEGQSVRLEFEGSRQDKYQRTRAYVYLADGALLNAALIREGYAHAYVQVPFSKMEEFRSLQREAMTHSRGLWAAAVERTTQAATSPMTPPVKAAPKAISNATETVYVTRTGAKYHEGSCRHLAKSKIRMALKDAAASYGPCSVCSPPILRAPAPAAEASIARPRPAPAPAFEAQRSTRCQATTKKGAQCKRNARAGRSFCWQH